MDKNLEKKLREFAINIRIEQLKEFAELGFGHAGGALSATDLIAVLYGDVMKIDPKNPNWEDRDRLVCSKGHAGPALYATLALKGYFPMDWLKTLNKSGTNLPSHCDKNKTPGIDMTTGSLGQGMSTAIGMALGLKLDKKSSNVYLILGDGEINEGQVWEGAMFANHHKLNNMIAFIDKNGKQLDGTTEEVMNTGDICAKFKSFGWNTLAIDGHNVGQIYDAIEAAKKQDKPTAVIMNTIKGKGVKEIEEMEYNHHINVSKEMADIAIKALEAQLAEVV